MFGLHDEVDSSGDGHCADVIGVVADDAEDAIWRRDGFGGGDDVHQERASADFVEDFGALGFEAGALAGGHDRYAE